MLRHACGLGWRITGSIRERSRLAWASQYPEYHPIHGNWRQIDLRHLAGLVAGIGKKLNVRSRRESPNVGGATTGVLYVIRPRLTPAGFFYADCLGVRTAGRGLRLSTAPHRPSRSRHRDQALGRHCLASTPRRCRNSEFGAWTLVRAPCSLVGADATPAGASSIAATTAAVILPVILISFFASKKLIAPTTGCPESHMAADAFRLFTG
jgi:hypothetical protein